MRKIKFIEDFAGRSKGDTWDECPSMLASQLVRDEKVAVYTDEEQTEQEKPKSKAAKAK